MAPRVVRAQIDAVATDLRPDAVKSGMLANASIVRVVAAALRAHDVRRYVLDPVMVSSSGTALLDRDGVRALRRELLPLATVVTPNLAEAAALTGEPVTSIASMRRAALLLVDRDGATSALITGGHLEGDSATDVFYDGTSAPRLIRHARIAPATRTGRAAPSPPRSRPTWHWAAHCSQPSPPPAATSTAPCNARRQ